MANKNYSIKATVEVAEKAVRPLKKVGTAFKKVSDSLKKAGKNLSNFAAKVGPGFKKLSDNLDKTSKKLSNVGKKMDGIGKNLSTKVTLPIVALGAVAINTRRKFEQSMNKVAAVTQATGEQFKSMEKLAMDLGRTTQFSASEAADAMSFLGMAGLSTEKIMEALPGTLQLAAAGGLDLASAADIATNVMTSMGMGVQDLTHINDVLATAQARANTNVYELAEAMRPVAGTASTLGVSIEELTAMLGKMADSGEKGGIAGTLLRNAMLALVKPTDNARKALAKYGININDFVTKGGQLKNFSGLIERLQKTSMTTGEVFQIFGERGARAILNLQKQGKNLKEFTKELKNSDGTAQEMADTMMKGLPGAMKRLASAWEGLMLKLTAGDVGTFINKLINRVVKLINWFSNLDPAILKVIVTLAGIVAVVGPILFIVGKFMVTISALIKLYKIFTAAQWLLNAAMSANPIGLVIIAIGALIGAIWLLYKNWDVVTTDFNRKIYSIAYHIDNLKLKFYELLDVIGMANKQRMIELKTSMTESAAKVGEAQKAYDEGMKGGIKGVPDFLKNMLPKSMRGEEGEVKITDIDSNAAEKMKGDVSKIIQNQDYSRLFGSLRPANAEAKTEVEVKVSAENGSTATINKVKSKGKPKVNILNQSAFGIVHGVAR